MFGDWSEAEKLIYEFESPSFFKMFCLHYSFEFFKGITYVSIYQASNFKEKRYLRGTRKCLKVLEIFESNGCPNVAPLCFFLRAELAAVTGKSSPSQLQALYEIAIDSAKSAGFYFVESFANERASLMCSHDDRDAFLSSALVAYHEWGATSKVEQLESIIRSLKSRGDRVEQTAPIDCIRNGEGSKEEETKHETAEKAEGDTERSEVTQ